MISDGFRTTLLGLIVFISAFLLFQIELIFAKLLLSHYGGSYLVWGGCMVFFQAVLLLGYAFAAWALNRWGMARYRRVHLALLVLPLLTFPGQRFIFRETSLSLPLMADIFLELARAIGLVFFVLSTMSVVLQMWLAESRLSSRQHPYLLFAISNLGSFLSLLSYPFGFEIHFDLTQVLEFWRRGYFSLIFLNFLAYLLIPVLGHKGEKAIGLTPRGPLDVRRILLFSAAGSVLFISVTNLVTYEVAPVPLLWVVPLAIYLLTFVLSFQPRSWCPRWLDQGIPLILIISAVLYLVAFKIYFPRSITVLLFWVFLFFLCLFCQNSLRRLKPQESLDLPWYYVLISLGGLLGSFVAVWLVPLTAPSVTEYFLGLVLLGLGVAFNGAGLRCGWREIAGLLGFILIVFGWNLKSDNFDGLKFLGLLIGIGGGAFFLRKNPAGGLLAVLILFVCLPFLEIRQDSLKVYAKRNYYGIYSIWDKGNLRFLLHGRIMHGAQFMSPPQQVRLPLTYFSPFGPMGEILRQEDVSWKRVGVIGLGAGSLAAYIRPGQEIDFYELDPEVYHIAQTYFSFLRMCRGQLRCFIGDARVNLSARPQERYDLIVADAFAGDSIPFHLLTREAIEEFRAHLKPGGVLVYHVSNRFFRLAPVLQNIAQSIPGTFMAIKESLPVRFPLYNSDCVLLTWDRGRYETFISKHGWASSPTKDFSKTRFWTDMYSNYWPIIKKDLFWKIFQNFHFFWSEAER